ncbi:MAG: CD225/dispanin family protein [Eubacteriales bacterium]
MKFCKNCSASLEDDAVFCTECGISLADDFSSVKASNGNNSFSNEGYSETQPKYSSDNSQTGANAGSTVYTQQQYSAPKGNNPGVPWMIVSIVMLCCCVNVFVIPGLVLSIISMSSFNAGDVEDARKKANTAMVLTIVGIVVGIVFNVVLLFGRINSGAFGSTYY